MFLDKRWKNLAAAIAAIAVIAVFFVFFFPTQSFDQRLAEMKSYWEGYGVDGPLHLSYEKLNSLDESELNELRASLSKFNETESEPAAKELSGAYVHLVDVSIYRKKMLEQQEKISSMDPCNSFEGLETLTAYKESLLESTKNYLESVDSFVLSNPEKAKEIGLSAESDASELEESVKEHKELVAALKGVCE